jgi:hypothetical protein
VLSLLFQQLITRIIGAEGGDGAYVTGQAKVVACGSTFYKSFSFFRFLLYKNEFL